MGDSGKPAVAPIVVWFRDDLRVADNPALTAAVERGGPTLAACEVVKKSKGSADD